MCVFQLSAISPKGAFISECRGVIIPDFLRSGKLAVHPKHASLGSGDTAPGTAPRGPNTPKSVLRREITLKGTGWSGPFLFLCHCLTLRYRKSQFDS